MRFTAKADCWSVGVVIVAMATGVALPVISARSVPAVINAAVARAAEVEQAWFRAEGPAEAAEVAEAAGASEASGAGRGHPPPPSVRPSAVGWLRPVLEACLKVDPCSRCDSAALCALLLDRAGEASLVAPGPPVECAEPVPQTDDYWRLHGIGGSFLRSRFHTDDY